jgi:stage II sporulation SpoE-like protein
MTGTQPGRWRAVVERISDRLSKSSRVFLIGLVVACGIEVAVDWNSTLGEINVLRDSLKQKGEDYVDILRRAAQPAVEAYDWDALDEMSRGLFDDEDVVYVRFSDALGNTLHDRVRADYAGAFAKKRGTGFRDWYRHQIERDAGGMMTDPAKLRERIAQSRHRDLIQAFTDAENQLMARFEPPPPPDEPKPMVLYQDRLYDDARQLDRGLSYALGLITTERGDPTGVALVAFRHDRMNRAVFFKLLKGLAITLFFVCLILVQNVLSRRSKLRLLDLEAALSAARAAIVAAAPPTPAYAAGVLGVAFAQADRIGGTVYDLAACDDGSVDLMLAVPSGTGVDAAFASVVLRDLYRRQGRAEASPTARHSLAFVPSGHDARSPAARVATLLLAYDESPLSRDVEILCAHLGADGIVRGVVAGLRPPVLVDGKGGVHPVALGDALPSASRRLAAPLCPFECSLAAGALALFDDGLPPTAARPVAPDRVLAELAERLHRGADAQSAADAAVADVVKRYRKKHSDDFFALVARRR